MYQTLFHLFITEHADITGILQYFSHGTDLNIRSFAPFNLSNRDAADIEVGLGNTKCNFSATVKLPAVSTYMHNAFVSYTCLIVRKESVVSLGNVMT